MDTHTHPAHDLLTSGGQSSETDEHEAAAERPAHPPTHPEGNGLHSPVQGDGHAEKETETTSQSSGDSLEPQTTQPLTVTGEHETRTAHPQTTPNDREPTAVQPLVMPDEHEAEASHSSSPVAPVLAAKPSTRHLLLGTALALAVMIGSGGIYILSHRQHTVRMVSIPRPVWHPEQITKDPADPVSGLPAGAVQPLPQHGEPMPAAADGDDILAMRHGSVARVAAAAPPALKVAPVVITQAAPVIAAMLPAVAGATPAHPDPMDTALALRPAPMTPTQQVDVLSLVTQLAALVRDMRTENAQLREKVTSLDEMVRNETADVSQRLSLVEARKAIASAQDAGKPPEAALSGSRETVPARLVQTVAVVPVAVRSVRDYRVQAASPGLAILADANAAPGQSSGLQVAVGDQVPGIGRITSIAQRGTAWVVQTSHGAIQ